MSVNEFKREAAEFDRLLEPFGFSESDLVEVVLHGLNERKICSPLHPRTYPGYKQWAETVRALREKTVPLGWKFTDDNNWPLSIHPSERIRIAVQTGDSETGTPLSEGRNPSNRAHKGAHTEDAVISNMLQLSLFDDLEDFSQVNSDDKSMFWVLLYHVTPNELRYELSLPLVMVGGKIKSWKERIVFPPIQLNQGEIEIGDDDGPEFDVPVERREP